MPRQLLTHSTLFGETSAALQHASVNSATKLRWDLTGMCLISVAQHCQMQTPQESNLYSRAWNVSPARTTEYRRTTSATTMLHLPGLQSTDVQPVSQPRYRARTTEYRRTTSVTAMLHLPGLQSTDVRPVSQPCYRARTTEYRRTTSVNHVT